MEIKPQQNTYSSNTTVQKSIKMKIGNVGKIMAINRKSMYSNPIQTLVQEYISNANDIHLEIKQTKPFVITLPNASNSFFSVRDFGTGLSYEQMCDVYTQYGVSTKDKSNDQQGGFGLGCKSFWAYSDAFYVISYFNGVKTTYLAQLGKSDEGDFDIVSEEPTDEPNGLEVKGFVNSKDFNSFEYAVLRSCVFLKNKPIIKGLHSDDTPNCLKSLTPILDTPEVKIYKKTDLYPLTRGSYYAECWAVIDNVIYPLDNEHRDLEGIRDLLSLAKNDSVIVLSVKVGQLDVSASREALYKSDKTTDALKSIGAKATNQVLKECQSKISSAKSLSEFIQLGQDIVEVFDVLKHLTFSKKGFTFNFYGTNSITTNDIKKHLDISSFAYKKTRKREFLKNFDEQAYISIDNSLVVKQDENVSQSRSRIMKILAESDYKDVVVIKSKSVNNSLYNFLVKELNLKDLNEYEPYERQTGIRNGKVKSKEEICLHTISPSVYEDYSKKVIHIKVDELQEKWIYIPMIKNSLEEINVNYSSLLSFLKDKGFNLCGIASTVIPKIKEDDNFITLEDFLNNMTNYLEVSEEEIACLVYKEVEKDYVEVSNLIHNLGIEDTSIIKLCKDYLEVEEKFNQGYKTIPDFYFNYVMKEAEKEINYVKGLNLALKRKFNEYPLLAILPRNISKEYKKEVIFYLNQKFSI